MFKKTAVRLIPYLPRTLVEKIAARYIAGTTESEALAVAERLAAAGFVTTLDILGEDTRTLTQAASAADEYVSLLETLSHSSASGNVSVKLTQLGLRLGEAPALANLTRLLQKARDLGSFVRIDMEDATLTDAVLRMHDRVRQMGFDRTGTVLQSRLRRTLKDATALRGANIRLCKGAYKESEAVSYTSREGIRQSYLEIFHALVENDCKVAAATHDVKLIARLLNAVERESIPRERVEFQALLGVPIRNTLEDLLEKGFAVRLYVPFGAASFAYSLRRLNENPDLAFSVLKGLFKSGRVDARG